MISVAAVPFKGDYAVFEQDLKTNLTSLRTQKYALAVLNPLGKLLLGAALLALPLTATFAVWWVTPLILVISGLAAWAGLFHLPKRIHVLNNKINDLFARVLLSPDLPEEKPRFFEIYGPHCSRLTFEGMHPGVSIQDYLNWKNDKWTKEDAEIKQELEPLLTSLEAQGNWSYEDLVRVENNLKASASAVSRENLIKAREKIVAERKPLVMLISDVEAIVKACPNLTFLILDHCNNQALRDRCAVIKKLQAENNTRFYTDELNQWRATLGTLVPS